MGVGKQGREVLRGDEGNGEGKMGRYKVRKESTVRGKRRG